MSRPLCILLPEIGVISETFLRWDVHELLPGGTVVIADPPPGGASIRQRPAWDTEGRPTLALTPVPGDPPPTPERRAAVAGFLTEHRIKVVLVEYLDFADRWLDVLLQEGVRVWLRGHGVDFSARLRERQWREAYRRYDQADGIVVPSHVAAEALVSLGLPSKKIHVVRYSVDLPTIAGISTTTSPGDVRCVAVGRLVPKKAPLLLLESFRRAATRNPAVVLDLVGDGPLMTDVRRYVDEHGLATRVRVHGSLPHVDALALIRSADLLLHHAVTSPQDGDTEGQPLAILEAMAAGLPVIATDHAGIPEAVTDGVHGRLVAEQDVDGMAAALLDLAASPVARRRLGLAARTAIEERHSHDVARRTLLQLFGLTQTTNERVGSR